MNAHAPYLSGIADDTIGNPVITEKVTCDRGTRDETSERLYKARRNWMALLRECCCIRCRAGCACFSGVTAQASWYGSVLVVTAHFPCPYFYLLFYCKYENARH